MIVSITAFLAATFSPQSAATPPNIVTSQDVVVTGLRDLDDPKSAVTRRTLGSGRVGMGAKRSARLFALAQRYARCAVNDAPTVRVYLRGALDGVINGASQRFNQQRVADVRASCTQDPASRQAIVSSDYDTSYYERGALFIAAMAKFAPDVSLSTAQTSDPAVQARFNAREIPLARFRLPVDRRYFEIAVCLVRLQPDLSVRLTRVEGADATAQLEAAIVNGGRICVGNAKKVYFDASQFRFYIADAVYRWAVAARGVDSLIPKP